MLRLNWRKNWRWLGIREWYNDWQTRWGCGKTTKMNIFIIQHNICLLTIIKSVYSVCEWHNDRTDGMKMKQTDMLICFSCSLTLIVLSGFVHNSQIQSDVSCYPKSIGDEFAKGRQVAGSTTSLKMCYRTSESIPFQ